MKQIKKQLLIIHGLGWFLALVLMSWILSSENVPDWPSVLGKSLFICALLFYAHMYIIIRFLNKKQISRYSLGLLAIFLIGPLLFLWSRGATFVQWSQFSNQYFSLMVSLVLICVPLSFLVKLTEQWIIKTYNKSSVEKQTIQTELDYLKWQINPHFLFNTLNNIHALSFIQSPATPDAILRLSSLMRYMLYEANTHVVELTKEIEYLQDFISLQQLRYPEGPIVNFTFTSDTDTAYVAPLLFIPLLENAYKHGPVELSPGAIKMNLSICKNQLTFRIQNPVEITKSTGLKEVGGIGLANVKKRLLLLYPNQHSLEVESTSDSFSVFLQIHRLHSITYERKTDLYPH